MAPEDDEDFELRTERWCAGLREAETRPLDTSERSMLSARIHELKLQLWSVWIAVPLTCGIPIGFAFWVPRVPGIPWLGTIASAVLAAIGVLWPALLVMRARRMARERVLHIRDLDAGEIVRFAGVFQRGDTIDGDQKRLMDCGGLIPEPGAAQSLDVLPHAGLAVVRRGRLLNVQSVTLREVAAGPGYAWRVEVPPEMARLENAPEARFMRRALNSHERAELTAHIGRLRKPGFAVLLWSTWVVVWTVAMLRYPQETRDYMRAQWMFILPPLVLVIAVGWTYARSLRLASRFEEDTRTGWALTLHRNGASHAAEESDGPTHEESGDHDSATPDPHRGVEFLPHSRAVWNERGRPARWRNLRRAA